MFEAIFTSQRNEFFGPSVDYNILRTYSIYRHMFKNTFSQCHAWASDCIYYYLFEKVGLVYLNSNYCDLTRVFVFLFLDKEYEETKKLD